MSWEYIGDYDSSNNPLFTIDTSKYIYAIYNGTGSEYKFTEESTGKNFSISYPGFIGVLNNKISSNVMSVQNIIANGVIRVKSGLLSLYRLRVDNYDFILDAEVPPNGTFSVDIQNYEYIIRGVSNSKITIRLADGTSHPVSDSNFTFLTDTLPVSSPRFPNIVCKNGDIFTVNAPNSPSYAKPVIVYKIKKVTNRLPNLNLNISNNRTLYENDTFTIDGQATDTDVGNAVTVKYQIDSGTVRNLSSAISDGTTPITFSKSLTYKDGVLKDGDTVQTSNLNKDTPHTLSVWAEDDQGGKSTIQTRTFYVVPNRAPSLTVNPIPSKTNLINSNTIEISGSVKDADNNDVTVTFKINDGEPKQVYSGAPSAWTFNLMLNDLKTGANTITIDVVDSYNSKVSKIVTINKTHNAVPINQATAMYKINPPTGNATKILMWLERLLGDLAVTAEVSMTNDGEPENFVALTRTSTAPINSTLQEDEFAHQADSPKTNIILKVNYSRTNAASVQTIKKLSGVLS